jgi:hypothetical protein
MNICKSEEHNLLVRSLLTDATANRSQAINTFKALNLMHANGTLNSSLILSHLRKPHGVLSLMNLPGLGHGSFILLMEMMLETV